MAQQRTYTVKGMDCAGCAETVENGIATLDGVDGVRVDLMTEKMHIDGSASLEALNARAKSLGGYSVHEVTTDKNEDTQRGGAIGFMQFLLHERETQFALVGGVVTLLTLVAALLGLLETVARYGYIAGVAIAGYPIAKSALGNLLQNRNFNLNMLMTIAAVGAIVIGEALEAATVVFLFAVGEALEGFTTDRARQSIKALTQLAPAQAHRLHGEQTHTVPVAELRLNDIILVKPGERIPMDGAVISGESGVNQAPITGESIPVGKANGDEVYAGTINGDGALTIRVTRLAADNTLSRIIQLVENAQSVRAPSQRRIDQFAKYYTPVVVVTAFLIATVPPLLFGAPFFEPAAGGHGWLYRSLVLLVIACPCALVISTPVAVVTAITNAARRGVLIKGGLHLEMLGGVKAVAFDKTGTLTSGQPRVTAYRAVDCETGGICEVCDNMLAYAASVEQQSTHPLAAAVINAARDRQPMFAAHNVTNLSGRGVQGEVNGHTITVGSHRYFDEAFPHDAALCDAITEQENSGHTTMMVAEDDKVIGTIAVADTPRDSSQDVVAALNDLGVATIMLTGDNHTVAQAVGAKVGVTDVRAELLPADKSGAVQALRGQYGRVAMIGDGVNDTPALAAADVGIAMGGAGSAQAIETADVALMADDLRQLPFTMRLSRFTRRLISQNIALAVGVKLVFVALAVLGITSLWLAIIADVGMLVLVTLNGMRPLRFA